ncbi:uncharacterized protein LOC129903951 isoform X2 [Solanum dulcamara]|nr:uncharacterized protein LOC129903951 isoform X2 [Solanum dulcamara]XP_055835448.1 uncharacterized protein LOC129903951 isoform X2 [Solanum dulcamara]XP_055835449.1 uncharacterized protein LOC129903951 isoform X2 [Solanum dulcamara]
MPNSARFIAICLWLKRIYFCCNDASTKQKQQLSVFLKMQTLRPLLNRYVLPKIILMLDVLPLFQKQIVVAAFDISAASSTLQREKRVVHSAQVFEKSINRGALTSLNVVEKKKRVILSTLLKKVLDMKIENLQKEMQFRFENIIVIKFK